MKKNNIGVLFLTLLILGALFGCKSAPPAETETPPPVEAEETADPEAGQPGREVLDSLAAAEARAAEARKLAMDFEAPAYCPDEWSGADSLYSQAESSKNTATQKDARESAARYNAAADALQAAADLAIPQYALTLENEVLGARQKAVDAGAGYWNGEYPISDYLLRADNTGAEAFSQYQAKDYYGARDKGILTRDMYAALESGLNAGRLRLEIEGRDFYRYDPAAIAAADETYFSAVDDYEAGDAAAAKTKADGVTVQYRQSLEKCRESFAVDAGSAASRERQKALDLKANVASRADYDAANAVYNRAQNSFKAKNFDDAAGFYNESVPMFTRVSQITIEKRRIAEDALRRADEKMTESDETAHRAQLILEGGAR